MPRRASSGGKTNHHPDYVLALPDAWLDRPVLLIADYQDGAIRVWSGTQNPHILRDDLALLIERPEAEIDVIRMEAATAAGPQLR